MQGQGWSMNEWITGEGIVSWKIRTEERGSEIKDRKSKNLKK